MGVTCCKVLPKVPLNARNDSHFIFVVLNGLRSVVAAAGAAAAAIAQNTHTSISYHKIKYFTGELNAVKSGRGSHTHTQTVRQTHLHKVQQNVSCCPTRDRARVGGGGRNIVGACSSDECLGVASAAAK